MLTEWSIGSVLLLLFSLDMIVLGVYFVWELVRWFAGRSAGIVEKVFVAFLLPYWGYRAVVTLGLVRDWFVTLVRPGNELSAQEVAAGYVVNGELGLTVLRVFSYALLLLVVSLQLRRLRLSGGTL